MYEDFDVDVSIFDMLHVSVRRDNTTPVVVVVDSTASLYPSHHSWLPSRLARCCLRRNR